MTKSKHLTQGDAPVIDRAGATDAEVVGSNDAPMPTVEAQPPYILAPTGQMSIADVCEAQLMVLSELFGIQVPVMKGVFRNRFISADKFDLLSDSAQRFFKQVAPQPEQPPAA